MIKKIISDIQDMTYLDWTQIRNSSGTAGSFLKAYYELNGKKIYYKLSNYDSYKGIVGCECVNELIADRLLSVLGIEHLSYQLIHAKVKVFDREYITWLCASEDFKKAGESKIALDIYYQLERKEGESPLEFCIRMGWEDYIYEMLAVDFLILNRDRHGANIEVLRDRRNKTIRLAPLFDHGLSFFFSSRSMEDIQKTDVMEDKPVQCFVGGNSAKDNLELIPCNHMPKLRSLHPSDKLFILEGLDKVLPKEYLNKIWEMIRRRWEYYESFCNQR